MSDNLYQILGLNSNATNDEIKRAFKRLAVKYHPDKNPGDPLSEEKFKKISHAWNVLSDPEEKASYDLSLSGFSFSFTDYNSEENEREGRRRRAEEIKRQRKEKENKEIERDFERISNSQQRILHYILTGALLLFSTWLVTETWYFDAEGMPVFFVIAAVVLYFLAIALIVNRRWKLLRYRNLKGSRGWNVDRIILVNFVAYLLSAAVLSISFAVFNGWFQLRVFGKETEAIVEKYYYEFSGRDESGVSQDFQKIKIVYTFRAGGKKYYKDFPYILTNVTPGDTLRIRYSTLDPEITEIIR